MTRLFVSYRRQDVVALVGRMYDKLTNEYKEESVFMDVESIPIGMDFRDSIVEAITHSDVFLLVIGKGWLESENGERRLFNERDVVRFELEVALENDIPIIPVLVGGASMPSHADLPSSLAQISLRNAIHVDHASDFHPHMEKLIRAINLLSKQSVPSANTKMLGMAAFASISGLAWKYMLLAVIVVAVFVWMIGVL